MAEQRTGINTGTGAYVATRDAYDQTPGARVVQRLDFCSEHLSASYISTPNRATSAADAVDITALSSASDITVGDKATLVVSCEFSSAGAIAVVVPVGIDTTLSACWIGSDMTFTATTLRRGAAGDYIAPAQMADVMGATYIRIFLKSISTGGVDIYAGVI